MIEYPVDRVNTRWTFWRLSTETVVSRDLVWPDKDGGPIPGLDPDVVPLRQVPAPQTPIDPRLQVLVQAASPVVDLDASTIAPAVTVALRPEQELIDAVRSEAGRRKQAALTAYGIAEPADAYRAVGLVEARANGQVLTAQQADWLAGVRIVSVDHLDAIDAAAAQIVAWINEHPGELPDIGDAQWPAAPSA
jgi:hypothetical protein